MKVKITDALSYTSPFLNYTLLPHIYIMGPEVT